MLVFLFLSFFILQFGSLRYRRVRYFMSSELFSYHVVS